MTELNLWSVTTLIKNGLGTGRQLVDWNARTPSETAFDKIKTLLAFVEDQDRDGAVRWLMDSRWKKSGVAMARGTDVHTAAEQIALGHPSAPSSRAPTHRCGAKEGSPTTTQGHVDSYSGSSTTDSPSS
jgi:hypothetical protein